MVQIGLTDNFKCQVLQWDGANVNIKEPSSLLGKSNQTKRDMHEVVMQTAKPAFTREDTERMIKILGITYAKAYLKQVTNDATKLNSE